MREQRSLETALPGRCMAQHPLHSKESRNFVRECRSLTEDQAEALFSQIRWGSDTEQACPNCGVFRRHYRRKARRRWRCADCTHEFSVTSGTMFHSRKLSYCQLLDVLLNFEGGAKGKSLLEVSRATGCTPKTVQANFGKIREMLVNRMDLSPLSGIVHMDGIYLCGKPRRPNRRMKMPKDALKVRYGKQAPSDPSKPWISAGMTHRNWMKRAQKRVVISLCQAGELGMGSSRVMAFVCPHEDDASVMALASHFVHRNSIIMSDESSAYTRLITLFEHHTVQHSKEYCTSEGVSNNMSETWNSRMRRNEYGVGHGFRPKYLQDYACEFVWRENFRRTSQKERFRHLLEGLMHSQCSNWWRGYWQGKHRKGELDLSYFLRKTAARN